LEDGETKGITGPTSWEGATYYQNTILKAYNGDSIIYTPVPYEYLFTQHTKPQVIMTVDSLPVACIKVDCNYMYVDATPSISSYSMTGESEGDTLTVNGANFATAFKKITFGGSTCYYDQGTSTTSMVECTFDQDLVAGDTKPILTDDAGAVPYSSLSTTTINLVISSVTTPSSQDINPNGGTQITITGSGFPVDEDSLPSDFSLSFPNHSVECTLQSVTST